MQPGIKQKFMKTFIKLSAVLLLSAASVFSAAAKPRHHMNNMTYNQVSIIPLKHNRGFAIHVDKAMPGKSIVIINDDAGNTIFKDCLTQNTMAEKKYLLRVSLLARDLPLPMDCLATGR